MKLVIFLVLLAVMFLGAVVTNAGIERVDYTWLVAWLRDGKIHVTDLEKINKELATPKGERIKDFFVSPYRTSLAMVTESNKVYLYLFDNKGCIKILDGKGEVCNVVFLNYNNDLLVSTVNNSKSTGDPEMAYPLADYYYCAKGKAKKTSLPHDMRLMVAGEDRVAAFRQDDILGGSFKIFNLKTGEGERVITPDSNNSYFPEISPGGRYLLYYFKDRKDQRGGMGLKIYDLKGKKQVVCLPSVYCYPSSFGPEPACWERTSWGKNGVTVQTCQHGDNVKNSLVRIDLGDYNFIRHESQYLTRGQYDFMVEDAFRGDILFLYRENENKEQDLYLVSVKGSAKDKILIDRSVTRAKLLFLESISGPRGQDDI